MGESEVEPVVSGPFGGAGTMREPDSAGAGSEERQIAAVDQVHGIRDQPQRSAPLAVPFPFTRRHSGDSEQRFCDRPVRRTGKTAVERAQHVDKPSAPHKRQRITLRTWPDRLQHMRQPLNSGQTRGRIVVQRNCSGERPTV